MLRPFLVRDIPGPPLGDRVTAASTTERVRAAEAAGTLESSAARTLAEAFGFIFALRPDHQVEQLRRGETPGNFIDPRTLNPLARSYLRSAFPAVASVQSGLATELSRASGEAADATPLRSR